VTHACPFCGGAARPHIAAPDRNRRVDRTVFHVRRCTACGLFFVADPPADIARYYPAEYHFVPRRAEDLDPHLAMQRFKIDLLTAYVSRGRLLEIGSGTGMFARLAQQAGFAVSAIEVDAACAGFLRDALGIPTVESAEPDRVLEGEVATYDAICLWHAIEHLPRPWAVIRAAAARLAPGGVLLVAAPNPHATQARLMGSHWPHWDLPRHLFALPIPWLQARAAEAGLEQLLVTTRDEGSLFWTRWAWHTLGPRITTWRRNGERATSLLQRLLRNWDEAEGNGAAYTAIFRKPAA
jgi:2-polyprenyl-3-methyl-5-hydroxy-6-metoxy-1,4-benzoquinol methylase